MEASVARAFGRAAPPVIDGPSIVLSGRDAAGETIEVTLALPDAAVGRYRGTRFAHLPMISAARWRGHTFWGEWNPDRGDPTGHDSNAIGTAEEFDINGPSSFGTTATGDVFLKVGVGLLKKTEKSAAPYNFAAPYEVVTPARAVAFRRDSGFVESEQEVRSPDGRLGYHLQYRVELVPRQSAVRITRTLTNRGTQPLESEHYCHNFLRIDGDSIGPQYKLDLSAAAMIAAEHAVGAKAAGLRIEGRTVILANPILPGKTAYASLLSARPREPLTGDFTLRNVRTGASLRASQGGGGLARFALFAAHGAICPEPFVQIRLAPGKRHKWETVYTLTEAIPRT